MLTALPVRKKSQAGASLIEVLVSIVIASIGLLGLAGINAASVKYSKMSQYRSTATQLVNDISERIRANNTSGGVLASYVLRTTFAAQATLPSAPTPACTAVSDSCTAAQMAAADLQQWRATVRSRLPEGAVSLRADAGTVGAFDLWIAWRDPALADADEAPRVGAGECSSDLDVVADVSVRCLYFRVQL
jgi:type IV pilus assembly protein PilV